MGNNVIENLPSFTAAGIGSGEVRKDPQQVLSYGQASSDIRLALDTLTGLPDNVEFLLVPSVPESLVHESLREVALISYDNRNQSWQATKSILILHCAALLLSLIHI